MNNKKRIVKMLNEFLPEDGIKKDITERVDIFKISKSLPRFAQNYEPSIIIIAQGKKRIYIKEEIITYDPLNYLVLSVPLPLECEVITTSDEPLLGIIIKVDPTIIGEILLLTDDKIHKKQKNIPKGIYSDELNDDLTDAVTRLLKSLNSSSDKKIISPMIVKEIIYRVLSSEKGEALRALAFKNQKFFQIAHTLDKIHKFYYKKFDLNTLAEEVGMSISAFHTNFKAVTNSSPLQYIKNIKLHKAKLLMIEEGENVYNAAIKVGYESPSQFNREYKRLFGITPGKDNTLKKN